MAVDAKILICNREHGEDLAQMLALHGHPADSVLSVDTLIWALKRSKYDLLILELCDFYCRELADEFQKLPCEVLFVSCGLERHGIRLPTGNEKMIEIPVDVFKLVGMVRELLAQKVQ
jgi:hypothetical protein